MKIVSKVKGISNNVLDKVKHPRRTIRSSPKLPRRVGKRPPSHVILGIGLLLVVVSIAYSTSVIYIGVDSIASRIALLPQVIFALGTLVFAFSKIFKEGA